MKVKGRIRLSPICPGLVRLRARTEVSLIVFGLIGGVGWSGAYGLLLWNALPTDSRMIKMKV